MRPSIAALNVAEAKRRLSDLLGRVAYGGETILITRRGRPMARLVPAGPESAEGLGHVEGWLENDDPYFGILERIATARPRHRPRALRARGGRKRRR